MNVARLADLRRIFVLAMLGAFAMLGAGRLIAQEEDTVFVSTGGSGHARLRGQVLDYSGAGLRIRMVGGHEKTIPAEKIIGVETYKIRPHAQGNEMFDVGRFTEAIGHYQTALKAETRRWVRREIMAQLIRCFDAMGQPDRAGNGFVALVTSDPATPYFDSIPLAWVPRPPSAAMEQRAIKWAQDKQPAVSLLGLSYLLSTKHRAMALHQLKQLAAGPNKKIAMLAMAQTWRAAIPTASTEQIGAWTLAVEKMPEALAAGPYFVLGTAWIHQQQWEKAALALMRVPILYPQQRALAAQALVGAARSMEKLGRKHDALRLYYELLRNYKEQKMPIAEAESRVEDLKGKKDS